MRSSSLGRRSSTNPVRISLFDREDKSLTRIDPRRTQVLKPKASITGTENSHIPRSRMRASSSDRASIRSSFLKTTGKTPLGTSVTPATPKSNSQKASIGCSISGNANRLHPALPTGVRSLSADRASSIGAKGPRKDTRPLTDKTYQTHMLTKIDNYFLVNQSSAMLNSNGSLKPITLKMFVEVSAYLLKILDIKQILTITNYVEELPKIAKKLHYPGIITKSWLKTANAMHSWPNVLGWICWLVEVCEIRDLAFQKYNIENLPFMGSGKQYEINKNAFFSMLNFYSAWNDEKLEEEAVLVERYLQEIENQQGVTEEDLEKARSELDEELLKLQGVEEKSDKINQEVEHLKQILSSLQKDEAKQQNDIEAKEEYLKLLKSETDQLNTESNILYQQIQLQTAQRNELISVIKQQPMSTTERDKIWQKCAELESYTNQFDEHLEDMQKELYRLDMKLSSNNNNLNKAVLKYNKEILMHLNNDVGVDLEELKLPENGVLRPQMMEILNTKANLMNDLKERLKKQITKVECFIETENNEIEILQERTKTLQDDIDDKLTNRKMHINKIKTEAKSEETRLREQIKVLQNDIKEIQEKMPNTQLINTQVEEAKDKLDAVRRKKMYVEESAKLFFDKFYDILGKHRTELHSMLSKLHHSSE